MAIIDCVRWSPQSRENIFAWRYPETNLSTATNLIVQESQVALLFSKGELMGKFGPGRHVLNTENLPILRYLYGIPFGGKNPFSAEVWFVNMTQPYNIGWQIDRMSIHDADYDTMLPLTASGQYGLKVLDPEKFLIKVVGTKHVFTEGDMTSQFAGEFTTKVKSIIMQFMLQNHIGLKEISAHLDEMSQHLRNMMFPFWQELGLDLTKFYVSTIEIDDSTPDGRQVKEALAQQTTQKITGRTWQQEQMFGTANNAIDAVSSMGGGNGGLLGGLMAINMMNSMGSSMGGGMGGAMMAPQYQQPSFGGNHAGGMAQGPQGVPGQQGGGRLIYCAGCSKRFSNDKAYCPHCGKKYNPCPSCGSDNDPDAKRCVSCGFRFAGQSAGACANCGTQLAPGAKFCSTCGAPAPQAGGADVCSRCGSPMGPSEKFCPRCGNRR